jgi:methyl coenzyme M reductase subunit D
MKISKKVFNFGAFFNYQYSKMTPFIEDYIKLGSEISGVDNGLSKKQIIHFAKMESNTSLWY